MFAFRIAAGSARYARRRTLVVETLEQRSVPAASIGENFAGPSSSDSPYVPPDTDGAIGPNHFAAFVNGRFKVYGKAAPHTVGTNISDTTFWTSANSGLAGVVGSGVSDPRIVYDPLSGRWFASEISINNGNVGNSILIGRSDTSDPTGTWKAASFVPSASQFADYDTLGVDANGVYVGTDDFPSSVGGPTSVTVISIPKADLLLSTPDVSRRKVVPRLLSGSNYGWTPHPVTNFNASPAHASIFGIHLDGMASPSRIYRTTITWGADPANPTFSSSQGFNVQPTFYPDWGRQPDASTPLDPIDDRIESMTFQVGDLIYIARVISVNSAGVGSDYTTTTTTDGIRLTVFSDSQNAVVAEGTWYNTNFDYLAPSVAANAAGDFLIGFTRTGLSSPSGRAGAYAVPGRIDPANTAAGITFGTELQLRVGDVDSYHPQGTGFAQRWGDYSATNPDPSNQTSFWTIQEFADSTTAWGTQISQVYVSPRVSGVTSTIADGTYSSGTVIPVTITFNDNVVVNTSGGTPTLALNAGGGAVATYAGGSGTNTLTFNYTVAPGQAAADLDYTSATALSLNGGTIKSQASGLDVIATLANPGAVGSLGNSKNIVINTTPRVGNVTSTVADNTYGLGAVIPITATFTSPVVVTGTPQLTLNAGAGAVATYASGSGSANLIFNYVVAATQSSPDLDYTSTGALTLNGGTIKDQVTAVNAILTLPAPGAAGSLGFNKNIVIDATGASVSNVSATNQNGTYAFNDTISVTITFTGPVTVTGSPKLALNSSGTAAATYAGGTGTATLTFNYTVAAGDVSADLDYTSSAALTLNGGTIKDQTTGLDATLNLPSPGAAGSLGFNKNIVIDAAAAQITNVTSTTANNTYDTGAVIVVQITFDKPVNVTGSPTLALNSSGTAVATYATGAGSANLLFNYVVAFNDFAPDLDYTSIGALTLNGGSITDQATGTVASLTLATPGTAGSLGFNKDIVIDARPARPINVTSPLGNGAYGIGTAIPITVTFSKQVSVSGTPQLTLNSSGTAVATYSSIDPTGTTLTFDYTVQGGDSSPDLDYTSINALTSGTITDVGSGTPAILTLPTPGAAGSLGANKNLAVDATGPSVVAFKVLFGRKSFDLMTSTRTTLPWRITGIQVVFSEKVYFGKKQSLSGITAKKLTGLGTTTLTWTFTAISKGIFDVTLLNTGLNALKDVAGNPIAAFSKHFEVLYGDFDDDRKVTLADKTGVMPFIANPYDLHPTNYNIFADLSGDGLVNVVDVGIAHNRKGQQLP